MTADDIIRLLDLAPHPEGGWYRQTWIADTPGPGRAAGTSIYYLLAQGQVSHWHRIDSAEIWHHYTGAPLTLSVARNDQGPVADHLLGPDLASGARPQVIVPPGSWQSARSAGDWSLVGCTVSPGFDFAHFEMAPAGWAPGKPLDGTGPSG